MDEVNKQPPFADTFNRNFNNLDEARKAYERQKKDLQDREAKLAWDRYARANASDAERRAANIIWIIREHEREFLFGNVASEAIPGPGTLDMGGQFLSNRQRVVNDSRLYQIAVEMPKNAHLHLHFNAELPPEDLLGFAKERPNMFIRST